MLIVGILTFISMLIVGILTLMPTIVGILTFMSKKIACWDYLSLKKAE